MALKDTWVNKVDGVDISSANDINEVAQAVIDLENESGSRPDFAANEGEKGFIKNRTHYIDKDGKVQTLPIEFIPEGVAKEKYVDDSLKALFVPRRLSEMVSDKYHRTVEDDEKAKWNDGIIERWEITENYTASSNIVIAQQSLSSGIWMNRKYDIEPGMPYAVYIGGKEYFCIAGNEDGTIYLGNPKLFDSASTQAHNNEPFCITWAGGAATAGMFFKDSTLSYPLTLKVTGAAVTTEKKFPREYLPDGVAMKSDIPEGGGSASIDVTASVGQTIVVEEVDADGKPTKWKAAEYQPRTHWKEEGNVQVLKYLHMKSEFEDEYGAFAIFLPPSVFNECVEVLPLASIDTIEYDDVEYTNLATFEANEMRFFGNLYFLNSIFGTSFPNTGEPFVLGGNEYGMLLLNMDTEATLHALQIYVNGTKYHRIDKRYQPEIPTIDLTPYYTDDNNTGFVKVTGDDYFEKVYSVLQRSEIVRVVYRTSYGVGMATGLVGSIAGMGNIEVLTPAIKLSATSTSLDISY